MSTFDHAGLIQNINASLGPFRKSQSQAMTGFSQLAKASMAEGAISAKHKELIVWPLALPNTAQVASGFMSKRCVNWVVHAMSLKKCLPFASIWAEALP